MKTLLQFALLTVLAGVAAPGASVSCQRDIVPGDGIIEVTGPQGTRFRTGGGKTTLEARLPQGVGVSIR